MKVNIRIAVCICDFVVINFGKPIICCNCAGVGENQSADGIGDGGIFLDSPVGNLDIFIDKLFIVEHGGFHIAQLFALPAVENIGLCDIRIVGLDEDGLDAVLNIFHSNESILDFRFEIRRYFQSKEINGVGIVISVACLKGLRDGMADLREIKVDNFIVSFSSSIHVCASFHTVNQADKKSICRSVTVFTIISSKQAFVKREPQNIVIFFY